MRLYNEKVRLIPFEEHHWPYVYAWQHSGDYDFFFGNVDMFDAKKAANIDAVGKVFIIVNPANVTEIMGVAAITKIQDRHRNAMYSILIDKKYQGKSLYKDVSIFAIGYALNMINLYKITASVDTENEVSKHITESFGFTKEAELFHEVYYNGEFKNVIRYYITKSAFNKKYKVKEDKSEKVSAVAVKNVA